jgi:hypothetical protein
MSQLNLQINFNPKVIAAALIALGSIVLIQKIPETKAQSSNIAGLTGKYGCLANSNATPYLKTKENFNGSVYMNNIGIIDFDSSRANATASIAVNFNSLNTNLSNDVVSTTFTLTAGPFTGSYTATFAAGGIDTLVPVNSGNTILGKSSKTGTSAMTETYVCQKL